MEFPLKGGFNLTTSRVHGSMHSQEENPGSLPCSLIKSTKNSCRDFQNKADHF